MLTSQSHDILILARKDISAGDSADIPFGEGNLDLGGSVGNVTYNKVDWKFTDTPDINGPPKPKSKDPEREDADETLRQSAAERANERANEHTAETGKNQRAWAKSIAGFGLLGSARFVITDRLHGHILSTLIGVPHVLLDSKLGKNLSLHDAWTKDCACTRIAENIGEAKTTARLFFEAGRKE
jgi:exopolysaccharide biosynthesis predicted pyruvyltransferase EpsI